MQHLNGQKKLVKMGWGLGFVIRDRQVVRVKSFSVLPRYPILSFESGWASLVGQYQWFTHTPHSHPHSTSDSSGWSSSQILIFLRGPVGVYMIPYDVFF